MLRDQHYPLRNFVRKIGEVIDVRFRNDEALAWRCWLQRHECSDDIILVHKARWSFSRDDFAEDAIRWAHAFVCGWLTH